MPGWITAAVISASATRSGFVIPDGTFPDVEQAASVIPNARTITFIFKGAICFIYSVSLKSSLRLGNGGDPAEAFAKGGNSDEQHQGYTLKFNLYIFYREFPVSIIVKNHMFQMILFITNVTDKFDNNRHLNSRHLFTIPFSTILSVPVLTLFPVTVIENSASHFFTILSVIFTQIG